MVAACGAKAPPAPDAAPPAVLADPKGPAAQRGACATASALDATEACRIDGQRDLDGDGAVDCWRAAADGGRIGLWIWGKCEGTPLRLEIEAAPVATLEVPAPWTEGVARLIGPAPDEAWQDGTPVAGAPTATVAGTTITIGDPGADTPGLDPRLEKAATCDAWEVWVAPHEAAIVDRAAHQWRRFGPTARRLAEAACNDDLVILPTTHGVDIAAFIAVAPRTGRWIDEALDVGDGRTMLDVGWVRTGRLGTVSIRQLAALLDEPASTAPPPACPDGPLLALPPGPPCVRTGKCWSATRSGNAAAGTLDWHFEADLDCKGKPVDFDVSVNRVVSVVELPVPARWIGPILAGDQFGCLPLSKKKPPPCPVPGPHAQWLYSRLYHLGGLHEGSGLTLPVWQSGTPALPPPSATWVRYLPELDGPALLVHNPSAEPVRGAPLALSSSCTRWDVWTAPAAAAVVDRATQKWTWVYFAAEVASYAAWPTPVGAGRCDDQRVFLTLGPDQVVVDPVKGSWVINPP